jgi:paraquat-inducible protein B
LLQNVDTNLAPQVQSTLSEAQAAMKNAKEILSQDGPSQSDLGSTLMQVARAAKSISALVDYLQRHPESLLRGKPGDAP